MAVSLVKLLGDATYAAAVAARRGARMEFAVENRAGRRKNVCDIGACRSCSEFADKCGVDPEDVEDGAGSRKRGVILAPSADPMVSTRVARCGPSKGLSPRGLRRRACAADRQGPVRAGGCTAVAISWAFASEWAPEPRQRAAPSISPRVKSFLSHGEALLP